MRQKSTQRPAKTEDGMFIVYSEHDLPAFSSERDEHEFWATHTWSEEMMDKAEADPALPLERPKTRSSATSIRLEADTLKRLKHLAAQKGMGYQTLLKTFVSERLYEEEKREGVVGR